MFEWIISIPIKKVIIFFQEKTLFEEYLLDVPEKVILYTPDVDEIISY